VVHLGKSVHCGHYVSYVKKGNNWIYFNDEKVAMTDKPLLGKGYILVYK
jgi:ubiquitin carboxyl-terminal hydrolase 5/13